MSQAPLEIRLELDAAGRPDVQLRARLVNRGREVQRVLRHSDLQPARLILIDAAGREVTPFDDRTQRRFDTSVTIAMYATIEPGKDVELDAASFVREAGGYTLHWGPYLFEGLASGPWQARVVFESRIDWVTADGRRTPARGPVWIGTTASEPIQLKLP